MVGRRRVAGVARLENDVLIFRGSQRIAISRKDISRALARDHLLEVHHGGGIFVLDLGEKAAARWAEEIRSPKTRIQKLGVKDGQKVVVLGVEDAVFLAELAQVGATVLVRPAKSADAIFVGISHRQGLSRLAKLAGHIVAEGCIWVVRPKGSHEITERDVMAAGKAAGLVDVKVVAFSPTLTAEKFVIPVAKRNKRTRRRV